MLHLVNNIAANFDLEWDTVGANARWISLYKCEI